MTPLQLKFTQNAFKHGVSEDEIWEVFLNRDLPCVIIQYKTNGVERIYNAYGVTDSGRYLVIGFVKETEDTYRIIHAMNMKESARKRYKKMRKLK
ncbi:MAG: BrnT family toxin [bacterium]